jgi:hypothetical protein
VQNIAESDTYWDQVRAIHPPCRQTPVDDSQYTVLFDSASDVFSLISPQDSELRTALCCLVLIMSEVRRALVEAPENVATLIRVITSRLFNLVSDHTFPSVPTTYVSSFASSLLKGGTTERNTTKEVLNCLRVLQRVLPVIFELESEPSVFEKEVLWKKDVVDGQDPRELTGQTPQFVIEDDDDDGEGGSPTADLLPKPPQTQTTSLPSLAEKLFGCLIDLLFCCGFTLPSKLQVDHYKINYVIWWVAQSSMGTLFSRFTQGEGRGFNCRSWTHSSI